MRIKISYRGSDGDCGKQNYAQLCLGKLKTRPVKPDSKSNTSTLGHADGTW